MVIIDSKYSLLTHFLDKYFVNTVRKIRNLLLPKLLLLAGDVELNPGPYDTGIVFIFIKKIAHSE